MPLAAQILRSFLQRKQIATLQELKEALGTISTMTVSSLQTEDLGLSRPGYSCIVYKYYTLADIPRFDAQGLWSCRNVWFSHQGEFAGYRPKIRGAIPRRVHGQRTTGGAECGSQARACWSWPSGDDWSGGRGRGCMSILPEAGRKRE